MNLMSGRKSRKNPPALKMLKNRFFGENLNPSCVTQPWVVAYLEGLPKGGYFRELLVVSENCWASVYKNCMGIFPRTVGCL